ncbi:MAG: phosphoenolpyruvate synthase [Deltaproteobacteria bacterium]|nr:phosphoenolpyruvate synthase [Deltaproteobacteria bacterium]MBI4795090.1 phosphoenolpyruvate synthase [Deltaproteobacteria bacterium]
MVFRFLRRFLKEEVDEQTRLRIKFDHFRRLLENNTQALEIMADMEEKLSGDFLFDTVYLQNQVERLGDNVSRLVTELNLLTENRYPELRSICQAIQEDLGRELITTPAIPPTPFVLPLSALTREMASSVGAKMANLGELGNRLHLRVPEGFAVTASAYKRFLEASDLEGELAKRLAQAPIDDLESLEAISREIQTLVRQAPLPPDLDAALKEAGKAFEGRPLAVRSSAVGEDTEFSFAGQFATLLNVDVGDLPTHYKEIVASKFTSRAIFYWKYQHFSVEELPMAAGCLAMVPARASGVMFSLDPHAPESNTVLISAVWGLGKYAVDGAITPDLYRVSREPGQEITEQRVAEKPVALVSRPEGGTEEVVLDPDKARSPCLSPDQIQQLAAIALKLEKHFGHPQDIEWALDDSGAIFLLQSRPLRVSAPSFAAEERESTWEPVPPLLRFGIRAAGGAAAGRVFLYLRDEDVANIPPGAVVVARQPAAKLVLVMDRIAAILTEVGSPTDHMSILAREFRVPTLVEVGGATRVLHTGQVVTVDADAARVYPGLVPELLEHRPRPDEDLRSNPIFQKLGRILKKATPLNLLDPESPEFEASRCRTFHDITRFAHEKSMDAMFALDVDQSLRPGACSRLRTDLPLNLFILNLGGGLKVPGQSWVTEDDILSRPFRALLRGFHHPQVTWAGQVAPDLRGFISVFANTMYDLGKSEKGLGGKSFAVITDNYLNFNSRLGYHFAILDAYISEEKNDNYISFQFKGGAAGVERRERRARLLSEILDYLGFKVQVTGDMVRARMVKYSLLETEQTLELVGLLSAFARQLDLALSSEAVMARCFQAFKDEDYNLSFLRPEQRAT